MSDENKERLRRMNREQTTSVSTTTQPTSTALDNEACPDDKRRTVWMIKYSNPNSVAVTATVFKGDATNRPLSTMTVADIQTIPGYGTLVIVNDIEEPMISIVPDTSASPTEFTRLYAIIGANSMNIKISYYEEK